MNGTTGLASWRMTGPIQTMRDERGERDRPDAADDSRQPPSPGAGASTAEPVASQMPATTIATSIPMRTGCRNRPERAPACPRSNVSLRTAATIAARSASADGVEGPPAGEARQHEAGAELEGGSAEDQDGGRERHRQLRARRRRGRRRDRSRAARRPGARSARGGTRRARRPRPGRGRSHHDPGTRVPAPRGMVRGPAQREARELERVTGSNPRPSSLESWRSAS